MMSNALAKWQGISLILRIIIGMIIGIAFALSVPGNTVLPIFGKVFVGLLKGIALYWYLFWLLVPWPMLLVILAAASKM